MPRRAQEVYTMEENNYADGMEEDEEMDESSIIEHNDVLLNALLDLLIQKGIITEEEFNTKVEEFTSEEEAEE